MRLSLLSIASAVVLVLCVLPTAYAGRNQAPPDTTSATRLFDPPRVITPDDPSTPQAEPGQTDSARETGEEVPSRCRGCLGSGRGRIGGGGGPVPAYLFANLDVINAKVQEMGIPKLSEGIIVMGGKGYARIGNLIIGGAGYGGSTESSGIPDCCARHAEVTVGYGGLILGLTTSGPGYEATAGMLFGGGVIEVERVRNSQYAFGWNDSWGVFESDYPDSVATSELNVSSTLEADFIALEPFVEIRYWVFRWMALDFSLCYLRARVERGEWTQDGIRIPDSPETDIGGPSIKLGIYFGV